MNHETNATTDEGSAASDVDTRFLVGLRRRAFGSLAAISIALTAVLLMQLPTIQNLMVLQDSEEPIDYAQVAVDLNAQANDLAADGRPVTIGPMIFDVAEYDAQALDFLYRLTALPSEVIQMTDEELLVSIGDFFTCQFMDVQSRAMNQEISISYEVQSEDGRLINRTILPAGSCAVVIQG